MSARSHTPSLGALGTHEPDGRWIARLRLAAALLLLALVAEVAYIALTSPRFAVRRIILRGDPRITRDVAPRLRLPPNTNFLRAPTRLLAEQAEAVPAVAKARVSRALWGRLVVTIQPREPVAVIRRAEEALLVAPGGVAFSLRDEWGWGLPELIGPNLGEGDPRSAEARREIAALLTVLHGLDPDPSLRFTSLEFRGADDIELLLDTGARVQLGRPTQLDEKRTLLLAALEQLGASRIAYLNLSDPRAAYWRPRGETLSAQVR